MDKGLKISSYITPFSETDSYPTHLDIFGKGGIHSVTDIDSRNLITDERRSLGMLSYTESDNSMYGLFGGLSNDNWFKLFDFDNNQINFNLTLPKDNLWIGDENNKPLAKQQIGLTNLPTLKAVSVNIPTIGDIPIPSPLFDPLSTDWFFSSPWMSEIYEAKVDTTNPYNTQTVASHSLAGLEVNVGKLAKRFDNANFIVSNKTFDFSWDNPAVNSLPDIAKQLLGLESTYTFDKAQSLGELETGLLKNTVNNGTGILSKAISGKDYVDLSDPIENMQIALIRPLEQDDDGNDIAKLLSRVDRLPDINMPDLTYILQQPNENLPNAQGLNALGGGLLKTTAESNGAISIASGGKVPVINDYVRPIDLTEEIEAANTFATEAAAAAELAANTYFTEQMLPYVPSPIPLTGPGGQISALITGLEGQIANKESSSDHDKDIQQLDEKIDNLSINIQGDVSGNGKINDIINTRFTPNPSFSGNSYMRIPTGNIAQRPSNSQTGMIRYNTEL